MRPEYESNQDSVIRIVKKEIHQHYKFSPGVLASFREKNRFISPLPRYKERSDIVLPLSPSLHLACHRKYTSVCKLNCFSYRKTVNYDFTPTVDQTLGPVYNAQNRERILDLNQLVVSRLNFKIALERTLASCIHCISDLRRSPSATLVVIPKRS